MGPLLGWLNTHIFALRVIKLGLSLQKSGNHWSLWKSVQAGDGCWRLPVGYKELQYSVELNLPVNAFIASKFPWLPIVCMYQLHAKQKRNYEKKLCLLH